MNSRTLRSAMRSIFDQVRGSWKRLGARHDPSFVQHESDEMASRKVHDSQLDLFMAESTVGTLVK
jgi:hypothetical protein